MEQQTRSISMKRMVQEKQVQITLEDDFNVPDRKPDVERVITQEGRIEVGEINLLNEKILVKGNLHFDLLYLTQEQNPVLQSIQGKIPFDEMISMENLTEELDSKLFWDLEDLNITLINTRKISVRALLSFRCALYEMSEEQVTVDSNDEKNMEKRFQEFEMTELVLTKKDIARQKEVFRLPAGKPNINQIVYYDIQLLELECRNQDGQIMIRGDLQVFALYRSRQENGKLNYYEGEQSFCKMLPCENCKESMLLQLDSDLQTRELQAKPDEDGENRILEVEIALGISYSLYQKNKVRQLVDVYSREQSLQMQKRTIQLHHLMEKRYEQLRINEKVPAETREQNGQICHCMGKVLVEESRWEQETITVEGTLEVKILWVEEQENTTVREQKISLPFRQVVAEQNKKDGMVHELKVSLMRVSANVLGKDQLEVKAELGMELFVFETLTLEDISEIKGTPFLAERMERLPEIVGYTVQQGDTLWSIAKEFLTTEEQILELNQKSAPTIETGEKLLIGVMQ